jgi:hypothetical protein
VRVRVGSIRVWAESSQPSTTNYRILDHVYGVCIDTQYVLHTLYTARLQTLHASAEKSWPPSSSPGDEHCLPQRIRMLCRSLCEVPAPVPAAAPVPFLPSSGGLCTTYIIIAVAVAVVVVVMVRSSIMVLRIAFLSLSRLPLSLSRIRSLPISLGLMALQSESTSASQGFSLAPVDALHYSGRRFVSLFECSRHYLLQRSSHHGADSRLGMISPMPAIQSDFPTLILVINVLPD